MLRFPVAFLGCRGTCWVCACRCWDGWLGASLGRWGGLGRVAPKNSPRRLRLWNTKKDHSICEVNFHTAVLAVKLNRKRVAVCLQSALHVFDITDMKCLRTLETAPNPDGVMALSPNEDNCYLAFPDGVKGSTGVSNTSSARGEVSHPSHVPCQPVILVPSAGES